METLLTFLFLQKFLNLKMHPVLLPDVSLSMIIFLKELLPGYLWIFPLPNGEAYVGVGMLSSEVSRRKINLRQLMMELIRSHPPISERFAEAEMVGELNGWGLPLGSKKRKISGDHF